jgi:hypothetical protein
VYALILRDPLADVLGASRDGLLTYRYEDAVRLAGHSCPTVAGAWLMARHGLAALYPDDLPLRGNLRVELRGAQDAGTTGVVGSVLGLITGAAGEGGFKGLGARYARRGLLVFGVDLPAEVRLTRMDSGAAVLLDYHPDRVPADPALPALMARLVGGTAQPEERTAFARLWQERVRRILLEHGDDAELLRIRAA